MTYVKIIRPNAVITAKVLGTIEDPYVSFYGIMVDLAGEKYEVVPMPRELMPAEPMELGKTVTAITECDFKQVTLTFMRVDDVFSPWMGYYDCNARYRKWEDLEVIDVH